MSSNKKTRSSGIIAAARLKALGLDPVIVDRNQQPGDNWALRYDCLRFHIAKSNCETPYLRMHALERRPVRENARLTSIPQNIRKSFP